MVKEFSEILDVIENIQGVTLNKGFKGTLLRFYEMDVKIIYRQARIDQLQKLLDERKKK